MRANDINDPHSACVRVCHRRDINISAIKLDGGSKDEGEEGEEGEEESRKRGHDHD